MGGNELLGGGLPSPGAFAVQIVLYLIVYVYWFAYHARMSGIRRSWVRTLIRNQKDPFKLNFIASSFTKKKNYAAGFLKKM